ncbi:MULTISPECIES: DinB family protein [Pedobacter]|uniref:DinB family protein n=1 Tax=Pedobacter TaxID=84567 RepID=UPI00210A8F29|nr:MULTISPECIES: DinB family protein [unclassified Pedobacter]
MYRNIHDFLENWKYETESTLKLLNHITEETRATLVHEHVRSLERLAWHLTQTITEMGHKAGLFAEDPLEHLPVPGSFTDLISVYADYAAQIAKAIPLKWTDSVLAEKVNMYGDEWTKGTVLHILITHQSHHRGQMTVIMRILGLPVPGLYGPSKEEWAEIGMTAPE